MALKKFKKIDFKDKDVSKFQDSVDEYLNQLNAVVLDGIILTDVLIGTTTTEISHKLGRNFQGWHLLDIHGDARVWRDTSSTADLTKFLPLKASASVTVSLWVF